MRLPDSGSFDSRLQTQDSRLRFEILFQRLGVQHRAEHQLIYDDKLVRHMRELIIARIVHNRCDSGKEEVLCYRVPSKGLVFHRDLELAGCSIKTSYYYRILV